MSSVDKTRRCEKCARCFTTWCLLEGGLYVAYTPMEAQLLVPDDFLKMTVRRAGYLETGLILNSYGYVLKWGAGGSTIGSGGKGGQIGGS